MSRIDDIFRGYGTLKSNSPRMKNLLCIIAFITAVNFCTRAELKDVTEGGVVHTAVTFMTNGPSDGDMQDVLGIHSYRCNVHRTSLTNGLAVYVEINIEGKPPIVIASLNLDRATLENEHAGEDIPVFLAVNPVGSLDGEGIYSAKKLRCFLREAGVTTSGTTNNPFYKGKDGIVWWGFYPSHESVTVYKFMESRGGANSTSPKIDIRVRFHEF